MSRISNKGQVNRKKKKTERGGKYVVQEKHSSPITALDSFDFPPITTLPLKHSLDLLTSTHFCDP